MNKYNNAIISVSDKSGISEFAKRLIECGINILSTGGTASLLRKDGINVTDVSDYTGFPEMMDGRVKTLHPKIYGGILSRRNNPKDLEELKKHQIKTIDIVVVNLYPFEKTIAKSGVTIEEAIENIDIGGPSMLRAAAKNYKYVAAIVDPADYNNIIQELKDNNLTISEKTRLNLAHKVFMHTSHYDKAISAYLSDWGNSPKPE
ncbi:MAG: IMP cyclohydrolase [Nitrospirae bacterium]|nr:IMP cyclohydrolase [Nitrospirota bacterium]